MNRLTIFFLCFNLMLGTILVISSNHCFLMWLGLELSSLSLLPLLKMNSQSRKKEATLKYFLIQAFSAALFLKGATLKLWLKKTWGMEKTYSSVLCSSIMTISLMIKLGLAPCHFWFPDVLSGLPFFKGLIIASWQKMSPMFVLYMSSPTNKKMLMMCGVLSVLMGGWGGLNQTSTRKMLAYSSMSHLGWITCTLKYAPELSMFIFLFYMLNKTLIIVMCSKKNLFSLTHMKNSKMNITTSLMLSLSLLSLGGLPPLGGFMKKLLPLTVFSLKKEMVIMPFLMLGSLMSLYFYLRMMFKTSLILSPQHKLKMMSLKHKKNLQLSISLLLPLTMWSLLLLPIFYLFK